MKIPFLILSLLAITTFTACSQNEKYDCEAVLQQQPYIAGHHSVWDEDSIQRDMDILAECGQMDSVDRAIFQAPAIGQVIILEMDKVKTGSSFSYQDLLDMIKHFKIDYAENYQTLRKGTIARLEIEHLPVNLKEFEKMRPKLAATGMKPMDIENFKAFLEKKQLKWTYKEAMNDYLKQVKASAQPLEFPELTTLEDALNTAKAEQKNTLIYFSGWACVNARRFENQLLIEPEIQQLIQNNFVYRVAMVDDRKALPNGKGTVGEAHTKLQVERFKSSAQPTLYIVSPDGKILAQWSYPDGADAFIDFLEKGK